MDQLEKPNTEPEVNWSEGFNLSAINSLDQIPDESTFCTISLGSRKLQLRKTGRHFATYASRTEGEKVEGQLYKCYQVAFSILHEVAYQLGTPITYVFVSEIPSMQEFFKHKLNTIKWDKIEEYSDGRVVRAIYTVMPNTSTL